MLLNDKFQPGPRPQQFYPSANKWIFKETVVQTATRRSTTDDRWKHSGGISVAQDTPVGDAVGPSKVSTESFRLGLGHALAPTSTQSDLRADQRA